MQWRSPAFRLFCPDCELAAGPALLWWYSNDPHSQATVQGPYNAESMVLLYSQGLIKDATLVCATDGLTGQPPSLHSASPAVSPRGPGTELNVFKGLGYWFTYLELTNGSKLSPSGTPTRGSGGGSPSQAQAALRMATTTSMTATASSASARWKSLLFQLFLQGYRPGPYGGCWWYMDQRRAMNGPCDGEEMVLLYALGSISDSTAVCFLAGSDRQRVEPRSTSVFRNLGSLFQLVQQGVRPRLQDFELPAANPQPQMTMPMSAAPSVAVSQGGLAQSGMLPLAIQLQQHQQAKQLGLLMQPAQLGSRPAGAVSVLKLPVSAGTSGVITGPVATAAGGLNNGLMLQQLVAEQNMQVAEKRLQLAHIMASQQVANAQLTQLGLAGAGVQAPALQDAMLRLQLQQAMQQQAVLQQQVQQQTRPQQQHIVQGPRPTVMRPLTVAPVHQGPAMKPRPNASRPLGAAYNAPPRVVPCAVPGSYGASTSATNTASPATQSCTSSRRPSDECMEPKIVQGKNAGNTRSSSPSSVESSQSAVALVSMESSETVRTVAGSSAGSDGPVDWKAAFKAKVLSSLADVKQPGAGQAAYNCQHPSAWSGYADEVLEETGNADWLPDEFDYNAAVSSARS